MYIYKKSIIIFLILLIFATPLSGCPKKSENTKKQENKMEPPKELATIEEDIDNIISNLEKISKGSQEKEQKKAQMNQQKESPPKEENKQEKNNEEKSQVTQKGEDLWAKLENTVNDLHLNWNTLSPISLKAGAKTDLIEKMNQSIITLTDYIFKKMPKEAIQSANLVYKYIPDFEDLFKSEKPTDIKRIKYYLRQIKIELDEKNWAGIKNNLSELKNSWSSLKKELKDEKQDILKSKMEFGISELENAINNQNENMVKIELNVLEETVKLIEKSF